jgi:transposase-like protein
MMPTKYDKDVKAKAIRLVRGHAGDYDTEWAAIREISSRLGMSSETLRNWLRQARVLAATQESLYGSLKMWAHLQRQGIPAAKCTVERIMRASGWRGATRARTVRTTTADRLPAGRRIWSGGSSPRPARTSYGWRTSPTCRWPADSAIPRS